MLVYDIVLTSIRITIYYSKLYYLYHQNVIGCIGLNYFSVGIRIRNKNGDIITNIPQSSSRYKVEFLSDGVSWGSTGDLYYNDETSKKDVKYIPSKDKDKDKDKGEKEMVYLLYYIIIHIHFDVIY